MDFVNSKFSEPNLYYLEFIGSAFEFHHKINVLFSMFHHRIFAALSLMSRKNANPARCSETYLLIGYKSQICSHASGYKSGYIGYKSPISIHRFLDTYPQADEQPIATWLHILATWLHWLQTGSDQSFKLQILDL